MNGTAFGSRHGSAGSRISGASAPRFMLAGDPTRIGRRHLPVFTFCQIRVTTRCTF